MSNVTAIACRELLARYGDAPAAPYVPPLVRYTFEDAAAKGLRKLAVGHQPLRPVHFTALEMVQREPLLLLHGEPGSGKTTFALHLALHLAGAHVGDPRWQPQGLRRLAVRNDADPPLIEEWQGEAPVPLYLNADEGNVEAGLARLASHASQVPSLLIVDGLPHDATAAGQLLAQAAALAAATPQLRVLVLADSEQLTGYAIPAAFRSHALLPLLASQRAAWLAALPSDHAAGTDGVQRDWDNPALFMLSLAVPATSASALPLVNTSLAQASALELVNTSLAQASSLQLVNTSPAQASALGLVNAWLAQASADDIGRHQRFLQPYLAAQQLASRSAPQIAAEFHADAGRWDRPLRILARHWAASADYAQALASLLPALLAADGAEPQAAALLVADLLAEQPDLLAEQPSRKTLALQNAPLAQLRAALLHIIVDPASAPTLRKRAGHHLARYGDPRPLDQLITIDGGNFTMGSRLHPNSSPEHPLRVDSFRIGRYPVTNASYTQFIAATGRHWHSSAGGDASMATCPAVDLSWNDARAYCDWLTGEWRAKGVIGPQDTVRLPTEPEWEYAARGHQAAGDNVIYPWGEGWQPNGGNVETHGFNEACPVGLFPSGRAASGCEDMAGQVWEWTSTLWGTDMATPSWRYPYADDGREAAQADASVRRVLRGGCFSSGAEKACCTYRGSLEPDGFWRGNGFRVALSGR